MKEQLSHIIRPSSLMKIIRVTIVTKGMFNRLEVIMMMQLIHIIRPLNSMKIMRILILLLILILLTLRNEGMLKRLKKIMTVQSNHILRPLKMTSAKILFTLIIEGLPMTRLEEKRRLFRIFINHSKFR